jgi:hypothetical protein
MAGAALALALAACGASSTQSISATPTTPPRTVQAAKPRKHLRAAGRRRSARGARGPSRPPSALSVSQASSALIQPQPRAGSCHARGTGRFSLPDPRCTPGAVSPAVTQASIQTTICRDGYTETVRPPESVTEPEKEASLAAYGDSGPLHSYEYDHLVPLELGGAPNDPRNLWPEPGASPNPKDELEDRLRDLVCSGRMPLVEAQRGIARNWVVVYRLLGG